jgi:hypothetical protein
MSGSLAIRKGKKEHIGVTMAKPLWSHAHEMGRENPYYALSSCLTFNFILISRIAFLSLHRFKVKVEDPQKPTFMDTMNVTVEVVDRNDHSPVIHFPTPTNNTVNITYGLRDGSVITAVLATDSDSGENGKLQFTIETGDPSSLFNINRYSINLALLSFDIFGVPHQPES